MCTDEFRRMIMKIGQGVPTIPISDDHRNGDWIDTDIYKGEFYQDELTGKVYTRSVNGITDASGSIIPIVVTLNKIEINNLHTTSITAFTIPTGYGAYIVKAVMRVDPDGTNFSLGSGEGIRLDNSLSISGSSVFGLSRWGDPSIIGYTTPKTFAAENVGGYEIFEGIHELKASSAITGGGVYSTMKFYIEYQLYEL